MLFIIKKIIVTFIFFLIHFDTIQPSLSKIKTQSNWFVDENGRIILFHGFNAVNKQFPWVPDRSNLNLKNETYLSLFKQWGFNSVRLGLMWSGLYPAKNQLNHSYVNEIIEIVNKLEKYGIYTIIDLHQDMMSTKFASYDGFPLWFMNELPNSKLQFPWPITNKTIEFNIFASYITEACGFAFQCLYDNINNVQEHFFTYWRTVAHIFSNSTSILAYELINEPWAGNIYQNPLFLLPGISDKVNLLPLYDKTYSEIRKYDKETIVFYEPVTWGLVTAEGAFGTGFDRAPNNDSSGTALSWHFYCWLLDIDPNLLINGTFPNFVKEICSDFQLNSFFNTVIKESEKLGGSASFLTEFGTCVYQDPVTHQINLDNCKFVLDASDFHFQSWTYWDSNFFGSDSQKNQQIINIFSRVYPMATNGIPISYSYNTTTKYFLYNYKVNLTSYEKAILTTEIFVPKFAYPNDFIVDLSHDFKWTFNEDLSRVVINLDNKIVQNFLNPNGFHYGKNVLVNIFPRI